MESKKRAQLMLNVQNNTIINNIMGVFKTMINNILKPSNIIKGYKISNRIKWVVAKILNKLENVLIWVGYNWVGYKVDIIALEEEIKELKKINDNSFKLIEKDIKALELTMTMAKEEHESLKNVHNNLASDFSELKFKNDELQKSFNDNVLLPKCKEILKEFIEENKSLINEDEDYSYESELEQQQKDNDEEYWIDSNKLYTNIDKLVEDVYNATNYGNYTNKNGLKEIITKHINLNN